METLYSALGQFYFTTHSNSPPTFLQVVGWTKRAEQPDSKRRYVYVRKVPMNIIHSYGGGKWDFDQELITQFAAQITNPVHKPDPVLVTGNAIIIEGAHFLRYQSITIPLKKFSFAAIRIFKPPPRPPSPPKQPPRQKPRVVESDEESA